MTEIIISTFKTQKDTGTCAGQVLLVDRGERYEGTGRFATWWENTDEGGRIWGHYFDDQDEAQEDYCQRCRRGY